MQIGVKCAILIIQKMLELCFRFVFCLFWSKELKHGEDDAGDIPFVITAHVFCTD